MTRRSAARLVTVVLIAALVLPVICPQMAAAKSALRLNRKKATLTVGSSLRLTVKGTKKKVKWTTSRKKIATVTQKGKVTAKKQGTAKITAKVSKKKLVCKITVTKPKKGDADGLKLKPTSAPQTVQTQAPVQSAAPVQTQQPYVSAEPGDTVPTDKPGESGKPDGTAEPEQTLTPTQTPDQTPEPTATQQTPTLPPVYDKVPVEFFETTQAQYESGTPEIPVFSSESGVYESAFELGMKCQPGTQIYYTTDGSIPTEKSAKYEGTIVVMDRNGMPNILSAAENIMKMYIPNSGYGFVPQVDEVAKCTVIRAVAISPDHQSSDVVTKSYFVGNEMRKKYAGATVMSLVIDPDSLLNYETGIHVMGKIYDEWKNTEEAKSVFGQYWKYEGNYTQSGREWEREATIDYFDADGESLEFSAPVGIRLHGGASRMYAQKSFNFYFREEYGLKNLKYPLIPGDLDANGKQIKKYKSFMMRNGGNDTEYSKIRDVFNQAQVSDRAYGVQAARPCVLFINGEYWGLYNLTEKYSDNSIETNYGVDKDNVVMFKEGELDEGQDGDEALYEELWSYAEKDFTDASVYEEFCRIMDIDSFADYYATEIYMANSDWKPDKNYLVWRARTPDASNPYADGKWRYLLFDTEYSMGLYNQQDTQATANSYQRAISEDDLFAAVIKNSDFKKKFVAALQEIGSKNFNPNECSKKLDEYVALYKPLMQDYYARFFGKRSWQKNQFDSTVSTVRDFVNKRYQSIVNQVKK